MPVKLQCYFETNHSKYKEKGIEYFKLRCDKRMSQYIVLYSIVLFFKLEMQKPEASYRVGCHAALAGEAHVPAESFTVDTAECLLEEKSEKQNLSTVTLRQHRNSSD